MLQKLYDEVERENITIDSFKMNGLKGMSYQGKNRCSIAIDYSIIKNEREEKQVLAEELVHCQKGTFYEIINITNPLHSQNIRKSEALTARFAAKKLVPLAELQEALRNNMEIWDISETMNVDAEIITNAINAYKLERKI